jgi:hypothetical protein
VKRRQPLNVRKLPEIVKAVFVAEEIQHVYCARMLYHHAPMYKSEGSYAASLVMGVFGAVAGAVLCTLFPVIVSRFIGRLSHPVSLGLMIAGCIVVGALAGASVKAGGDRSGGIVYQVTAVVLAYAGMALGVAGARFGAASVFHTPVLRTLSVPVSGSIGRIPVLVIMLPGAIISWILAAESGDRARRSF